MSTTAAPLTRNTTLPETVAPSKLPSTRSQRPDNAQPAPGNGNEAASGHIDLEKELTCSICTDILYQPLTLLDCLHTFCGGCLKEWFSWQSIAAAQRQARDRGFSSDIHTSNPYTCPSCRAVVRETRPNATVTTLLEMWLKANPGREKSEEDKKEVLKGYTRGEKVLPDLPNSRGAGRSVGARRAERSSDEEEADRRLVHDVRELSLREMRERPTRRGTGDNGEERVTHRRAGRTGADSRPEVRTASVERAHEGERTTRQTPSAQHQARPLEHQSSLRSLAGLSDLDSQEMEDEIMRQIVEEGILDGIDLRSIDISQEDEISECIAQAYRRRRRERQREREAEQERQRAAPETRPAPDVRRTRDDRGHERQSRPPISRPQLLEAAANSSRTQRRSSSQGSATRLLTPNESGRHPSAGEATRSATDLSLRAESRNRSTRDATRRPQSRDRGSRATSNSQIELTVTAEPRERTEQRRNRVASRDRRATNPETRSVSETWRAAGVASSGRDSPAGRRPSGQVEGQGRPTAARRGSSATPDGQLHTPRTAIRRASPTASSSRHQRSASSSSSSMTASTVSIGGPPTSIVSSVTESRPNPPAAPTMSCASCHKQHIEYDLHYTCAKCSPSSENGLYALCLRCYKLGKGCKNWFGFGTAASARYEREAPPGGYPRGHDTPHTMTAQRYVSSDKSSAIPRTRAAHDFTPSLERGEFCSTCHALANTTYWRCALCSDGEWGFCHPCVSQARHCTHPLQPLTFPNPTSPGEPFTPRTTCNTCYRNLNTPEPHYHCPSCPPITADFCTPCYTNLSTTSQLPRQNGPQGWRRCPAGHRMLIIIGADERSQRVVVESVVGGWALHDDDAGRDKTMDSNGQGAPASPVEVEGGRTGLQRWSWRDPEAGGGWRHKKRPSPRGTRTVERGGEAVTATPATGSPTAAADTNTGVGVAGIPPSGGYGMKVLALWARVPEEGVEDELGFPRGAEVAEVVDINGDWCWGVYCRKGGLFPGGWGRVVGRD